MYLGNAISATANTGALTSTAVTISGLTASRALQTDGSKGLESSAVTTTELGRLSGVTGFKSGSIISPDRKVYFSYREKNNHKFTHISTAAGLSIYKHNI